MEAFLAELQEEVVAVLLAGRSGKRRGGTIDFDCPVHDDSGQNAFLRTESHTWGCWVCGDSVKPGRLVDLAERIGVEVPSGGGPRGYTLEDYADEKGFHPAKLRDWGVVPVLSTRGVEVVAFPCRRPDGTLVRSQVRGHGKKQWWHDDGEGTFPYGLDMLAKIQGHHRKALVLVEGVSDTHALWHLAVPALGVPGATAWKSEWAAYVGEWDSLYIWKEPGEGGDAFVARLSRDFPRARVLDASQVDAKDPAELRQKLGEEPAKRVLRELMADAVPVGVKPLVVKYAELSGDPLARLGQRLQGPIQAVPTPFPSWNANCRMFGGRVGLAHGWYVLIGGTAGFGKTYMATNLAGYSMHDGESVAFHSLEMGWDELALRMLAQLSGQPVYHLEPGEFHQPTAYKDAVRYVHELREQTGGRMFMPKRPLKNLGHVTDSIRFQWEVNGCRLHIVDYLQLVWVKKARDMQEQIIEVSHESRALFEELEVVGVGLSQFNRETSANRKDKPQKEGLLGGSALENDSDQTLLLDHSRRFKSDEGWDGWALLDKNRHGPLVEFPIAFSGKTLRMRERRDDEITPKEVQAPGAGKRKA